MAVDTPLNIMPPDTEDGLRLDGIKMFQWSQFAGDDALADQRLRIWADSGGTQLVWDSAYVVLGQPTMAEPNPSPTRYWFYAPGPVGGDPTSGFLGYNNADPTLATSLHISNTDGASADQTAWITATFAASGVPVTVLDVGLNYPDEWDSYVTTAAATNVGAYQTVPIAWQDGGPNVGPPNGFDQMDVLTPTGPATPIPGGSSWSGLSADGWMEVQVDAIPLRSGVTYWWGVVARNNLGDESSQSALTSFTMETAKLTSTGWTGAQP